jgi:aminoglycoside phosphotransferase (APT) family kinase protein
MLQAGMWLRRVHDASDAGTEAVDMSVIISRASEFARENRPNISDYERAVPKVLEAAVSEIGSVFHVPVAFTHGDFCLSNLISESANGRVAIIDFELCKVRPVYHDLFALLSELYSQFLNPLVPKSVIQSWEKAFWEGYGPASTEIKAFARALALARIFYHDLYRLLTRRKRKGWIAGLNAQLYRMLLEPIVLTRRLDLPPEICPL